MMITSLTNDTVKEIRALHLRKHREAAGLFIAEGLKIILSAVEQGVKIHTLVYEAGTDIKRLKDALEPKGRLLEVSRKVLEKISARDNPQSVIGVFRDRDQPLETVKNDLWVVLEEVHDPGNLGTIIRTADAVGAKGIILVGNTCDPFSLEAVRASMGSIFNQQLVRCSLDSFLAWQKTWTGQMVGTHLAATADYASVAYKKPLLLVMGSEQKGMSDAMSQACTQLVKIPMRGNADSLNLAVATGVMLYQISTGVT